MGLDKSPVFLYYSHFKVQYVQRPKLLHNVQQRRFPLDLTIREFKDSL